MEKVIAFIALGVFITFSFNDGRARASEHTTDMSDENIITIGKIIDAASPAVVRVEVNKEVPVRIIQYERRGGSLYVYEVNERIAEVTVSSGSGFFVSTDGYLLTNKHVVADEDAEYIVDTGEKEFQAQVVYRDSDYDLAVLKIDGEEFPTLAFGDPSSIDVGDRVIAIGNALGRYVDSTTLGTVSAFKQNITVATGAEIIGRQLVLAFDELSGLIETSAKVYPGDSGGPLLDEEGRVVGIHVATAVGVRVGYAIPAEIAKETLQKAGVEF